MSYWCDTYVTIRKKEYYIDVPVGESDVLAIQSENVLYVCHTAIISLLREAPDTSGKGTHALVYSLLVRLPQSRAYDVSASHRSLARALALHCPRPSRAG